MATLGPEIVAQVVATCQTNAGEIAAALGRTFDDQFSVATDQIRIESREAGTDDFRHSGLVWLFKIGGTALLAFLPESSDMLPEWCGTPDQTGKNKLLTLAAEFGLMLLPDEWMPEDNNAEWVKSFDESLQRGAAATDAAVVSLTLVAGKKQSKLWLVWPARQPDNVFVPEPAPSQEVETAQAETAQAQTAQREAPAAVNPSNWHVASELSYESLEDGLRLLPQFTRSLLKVKVPVTVTLATSKRPVRHILEIVPGAILQFDKSCEEPLNVEVGNQTIAQGEAVKVGDMFGLRVTSIVLPDERFLAVRGKSS